MDIVKVSNLNQIISFINTSSDTLASYIYKLHTSKGDVEQLLNESIHTTGVFCLIEDDSIVALITEFYMKKINTKLLDHLLVKILLLQIIILSHYFRH